MTSPGVIELWKKNSSLTHRQFFEMKGNTGCIFVRDLKAIAFILNYFFTDIQVFDSVLICVTWYFNRWEGAC